MKKTIVVFISIVLMLSMVTGCGKTNKISGPKGNDVVMNVCGIDISADYYRYTLIGAAMERVETDESFSGSFSDIDWNAQTESGKTLSEEIAMETIEIIKGRAKLLAYAKESNLTLTTEENESIDRIVDNYVESNGKSDFLNQLKVMGISSEDGFREVYKNELISSKMLEEMIAFPHMYIPEDVDITQYQEENRITVKHILVMNSSPNYTNPEEVANDILHFINSGEDFDALIQEFNEDPGQPNSGYTFGPGEMVKEFEDAAFKLNINEVSGVVKSEYGYHIIKRIVGEREIVNYITSTVEEPETTEKINEFVLSDLMNDVNEALSESSIESEAK